MFLDFQRYGHDVTREAVVKADDVLACYFTYMHANLVYTRHYELNHTQNIQSSHKYYL